MSFSLTHNSIFYYTALLLQWTLLDMPVLSNSVTRTFIRTFNMLLISFSTQQNTYFRAQVMLCGDVYSNCLAPPSGGSQQLVQNLKTCEVPMDTMAFAYDPRQAQSTICRRLGSSMLRLLFSETPGLHSQLLSNLRELFHLNIL